MTRILHVLEVSLPMLGGYTIRSRSIIENQKGIGLEPVVITSPLHDVEGSPTDGFEELEGTRHYRTGKCNRLKPTDALLTRLIKRYAYSRAYEKAIRATADKESIDIIHSHSSYLNGIRANGAGKALRIPTVYEVRGLWQDTAVAIAGMDKGHWKYRFVEYMERKAMHGADRVVAISEQLREELILRGIDQSKLWVVPNGVDLDTFSPREKDSKLLARYDLERKIVIGFIGSIRKLEGLSLLLRHFPELTGSGDDVRLLLVGGGDEVAVLQELAGQLGIAGKVIFTGRVAHDEVLDYYSVIDIFVYPRIDSKVNQKVTPLKPLEAMAMRKAVVGSDVGGLRELIHEGVNGLIYRVDDGTDLVRRCRELIEHSALRESMAQAARLWVERERDWRKIVLKYKELYADLARS